MHSTMQPHRPEHLSPYAEECLRAVAERGLAHAERSALLEPPLREPSTSEFVDSLDDLVAAKMVALVERGARRDFRDIYMLCHENLATPDQCWLYWQRRQELAASDVDPRRARTAIETHLIRIEMHRPLPSITTPEARAEAEAVRSWFRGVFLNAGD